jgi:hypothetical protein
MPRVDDGIGYQWRSETEYYGYPLVSVAFGRNGRGAMRVAKGWIAIGQFAIGVITIAQFGVGAVFGFGQFMLGIVAIGQFAVALLFGLGQFATGYVAIGQIAFGYYALCQSGWAVHLWRQGSKDPEAARFFKQLGEYLVGLYSKMRK